jgi:tRNA pseudouridine38-40 synthase
MRVAVGVEYNGAPFHGWQLQPGVPTVQKVLEAALGEVANHRVRLHCAGRTDAGVHALGQVAHFETTAEREPRGWVLGGNVHLQEDVTLLWAKPVRADFHARFSAVSRTYRYLILNRASRPGLFARRATWVRGTLDERKMHEAGQALIGTHDFSSFRALGCQAKHPLRTVFRLGVTRRGDIVELQVTANAFLHHMVRNIAGALLAVGRGERPVRWVGEVLEQRDRARGGVTAPPDGLYFADVRYPPPYGLPNPADGLQALPW